MSLAFYFYCVFVLVALMCLLSAKGFLKERVLTLAYRWSLRSAISIGRSGTRRRGRRRGLRCRTFSIMAMSIRGKQASCKHEEVVWVE